MSKQDSVHPRTAEDVNRRFVQRIKDLEETVEWLKQEVAQLKKEKSS